MSRRNKVNPDHYTTAGRLSPDDLARERRKQAEQMFGDSRGRHTRPVPPWMATDAAANNAPPADDADAGTAQGGAVGADVGDTFASDDDEAEETAAPTPPQPKARRRPAAKRSAKPKSRAKVKASGARGTPKTRKAPKARGSAARGASPLRARRPGAHKTASRGTQKATPKKGSPQARKAKAAKKAKKR